ncbi:YoaK family protein [Glycomyces sp. NRRL B-16210]|uniref:YoaK family protein n=1 Tax=Glycomyces sp. NRRL B-16210 TaxID=1463821 RepID=UPI00068B4EE6|nr:YoaK family protein [Glycomyces sp. NRRL B-16210]
MAGPLPIDRAQSHAWTALVLTALAGAVDGAGFLSLGQQFVANQTGNAVLLAVAVSGQLTGREDGLSAVGPLWSLIGFTLGAVIASLATRRHVLTSFGVPLLLVAEVAVLVLAGFAGPFEVAIALAAFAMGVQSIHATRIGLAGINTTVLTGTLIALSANLSGTRKDLRSARLQAGVWVVYLLAAGIGSVLAYAASFGAVCWSAAGVAAAMAVAGFAEARRERR